MSVWLIILRWAARLSGLVIASACFLLAFEEFPPWEPNSSGDWLGIGLAGIAGGALLLASRWELFGAVVSLAAVGGVAILTPWNRLLQMTILIMALPAALYLLDWCARQVLAPKDRAELHRRRACDAGDRRSRCVKPLQTEEIH